MRRQQGLKNLAPQALKHDKRVIEEQAGQRRVRFVDNGVTIQYADICNVSIGVDEVLLLFCNKVLDPGIVRVESKMALSLKNTKRLTLTLQQPLRDHQRIDLGNEVKQGIKR
jgi:hypothetical protein